MFDIIITSDLLLLVVRFTVSVICLVTLHVDPSLYFSNVASFTISKQLQCHYMIIKCVCCSITNR